MEKGNDKEVVGFSFQQKAHGNRRNNQANKNRIVAVNQEDALGVGLFIDGMVKLSKVVEEHSCHHKEEKDRVDGEGFRCKEVGNPHDHLPKSDDN